MECAVHIRPGLDLAEGECALVRYRIGALVTLFVRER